MKRTPVIGIVGGVGAGKSAVAKYVLEHAQVAIIDGDVVGHEGLKKNNIKAQILSSFGNNVFNDQGDINRSELGKLVFGNGELPRKNLQKLNAIIHPWMEERFGELIEAYRRQGGYEAIIFDAAILLDAGWDRFCDRIVYIDVSRAAREQRVREQRAWSKDLHRQREVSQLDLEQKKQRADKIILNNRAIQQAGEEFIQYVKSLSE